MKMKKKGVGVEQRGEEGTGHIGCPWGHVSAHPDPAPAPDAASNRTPAAAPNSAAAPDPAAASDPTPAAAPDSTPLLPLIPFPLPLSPLLFLPPLLLQLLLVVLPLLVLPLLVLLPPSLLRPGWCCTYSRPLRVCAPTVPSVRLSSRSFSPSAPAVDFSHARLCTCLSWSPLPGRARPC